LEENVTLGLAFVAGVISFISPCVLPLIPGYLSYISGLSLEEMRGGVMPAGGGAVAVAAPPHVRRRVLLSSAAFILGFTLIFVALGASASTIGRFLLTNKALFGRIAGTVIILFGLHMMGVIRIEWLYREKRLQTTRQPGGPLGAVVVGMAFALGWTPCIGPILGAILAVAATRNGVGEGVKLLAAYSLGLGVPFFATALAINHFFAALARIRRHYHKIELASGLLLVVVGLLIFFDKFTIIAQWLTPYLPVY
jgi:cytochrome c-type biogenesis protein